MPSPSYPLVCYISDHLYRSHSFYAFNTPKCSIHLPFFLSQSIFFGAFQSFLTHVIPLLTYLLTYLLTCSMVQSPSWKANWFAASQEIPLILWNPKVYYPTHKRPPPVPILGQPNPVHIPTSHLLEIHPNIIHPSTPRATQWSLSLRFPHKDPMHPPIIDYKK